MSDVSNSSAWETLPEDEPPLCIAVRRPVSPPRHYEAVNRCGVAGLLCEVLPCQKKGTIIRGREVEPSIQPKPAFELEHEQEIQQI
ncbi:hypothetical protein RB195_017324 [Necator americanus]|uniref:Uncharacterized protein n=1 Tax=Necator americanus TaxID=51031 RepID=A0ABR1C7T7_NECAM